MSSPGACDHCGLPVGRLGRQRDIDGIALAFCCYGCCLAYQMHHGARDEPQAAAWLIRLGVGAFLTMNVMLFSLLLYAGAFSAEDAWLRAPVHWLLWLLATPMLLVLGGPFFEGAWAAARQGRLATDTLVAIGVLAAYGYSAWQVLRGGTAIYFDTAGMVLLLFTLGRYLEAQGRAHAARSLAPMLAAERAEVRLLRGGVETLCPIADVAPGDLARVLPGERVPVDGVVVEGSSDCDESVLTGQSQPRAKAAGDTVHAGSLNGRGLLLVRASVAGTQTRWVQIGRLVREALASKSLAGESIDRIAGVFIPAVLLLALASACFWGLRGGLDAALLAGLAVLVVACPCSLGLAAPLAMALAIGEAAQRGILVRGGAVLERLARLKGVAFDKTGTLTEDCFRIESVRAEGADEALVLERGAALAQASEHPIARALLRLAQSNGSDAVPACDVEAVPGAGLIGRVDGLRCAIGSVALMRRLGWALSANLLQATPAEAGATLALVGWQGRVHGRIALGASPLPDAAMLIAALHGRGLRTLVLSGDSAGAVARSAAQLGVAEWHADLMPEQKPARLRAWQDLHGSIAMVGDGLNDAPALAAATVGIAVGGATDLAKESADVVLPRAGLACLPWLLQQAAEVQRSVRINIAWAFGYNAIALALAASGWLQPVLAAALMAGSSLLVVLRSWRASVRGASGAASVPLHAATPSAAAQA